MHRNNCEDKEPNHINRIYPMFKIIYESLTCCFKVVPIVFLQRQQSAEQTASPAQHIPVIATPPIFNLLFIYIINVNNLFKLKCQFYFYIY